MSVSEDKIALVKALFQRGLDAQEKIFDEAMQKHEEEFFMSSQPCGCDPELEIPWVCERHRTEEVNRRDAEWIRLHPQYAQDKAYREGRQWPGNFTIKDSGQRQQFSSGMQRDVTTEKTDYSLVFDGPLLERLAVHLTKGARKYDARNWMKATGQEELDRFRSSAVRHFVQWLRGDQDEDHFSATVFNLNGAEYVKAKLEGK